MPSLGGPIPEAPRAIIFDIGRVIVPVDMSRALAALGKSRDVSSDLEVMRELEADSRWLDWQEGRMAPREWHEHISQKFHLSLAFEEFCAIWCSVLSSDPILPEALFERLRVTCRLALLSNTDPIHVAHMEATFPFVRHFPVRVYSCRIGASKPLPPIFHRALRELDVLPEETMFIDDVRENVAAAAILGINAFHFISAEELLAEFSRLALWAP